MFSNAFDPKSSFLHLPIVWAVIVFMTLLSIITAITIVIHTPLTWDFSANGFNYFISIFRFPLSILALIIPLVALLAANHRSEQTKEQISVTAEQNKFANYYKHIEEFVRYCSSLKKLDSFKARYIHKNIFPEADDGEYHVAPDLLNVIIVANELPNKLMNNFPSEPEQEMSDKEYNEYINTLSILTLYLDSDESYFHPTEKFDDLYVYTKGYVNRSVNLIESYKEVLDTLELACEFSKYHENHAMNPVIKNLNVSRYSVTKKYDSSLFSSSKKRNNSLEKAKLAEVHGLFKDDVIKLQTA